MAKPDKILKTVRKFGTEHKMKLYRCNQQVAFPTGGGVFIGYFRAIIGRMKFELVLDKRAKLVEYKWL